MTYNCFERGIDKMQVTCRILVRLEDKLSIPIDNVALCTFLFEPACDLQVHTIITL